MASEILEMKEAILVYLDRSGGLEKFMNDCKVYDDSKQSFAVYRFNISVNPSDLTEIDTRIGNYVLHQPLKAVRLFQSVCFIAIKTLSLVEQLQTENQVNIVLKLTHLPPLPNYFLNMCEYPYGYRFQRYYIIEGVVMAMTTVTKYTQGARFLCSEVSCPFSTGFQFIRVHTPGAIESATVRNDFSCNLCTSPLKEDMKFRVLGDKQLVEMIDLRALIAFQGHSINPASFRFQSFTVFLRDELPSKMKLGRGYKVIGIPACTQSSSQMKVCVEANSIQPWIPAGISDNFRILHSSTSCSPWRFTAILANIFASQVLPLGSYNLLKLCLLLSLVKTYEEDKETTEYLDLLVVASDTLLVERLLTYSLCLVPRGLKNLASTELFATVSKDEHGTGSANIQAGTALLAEGGVCFTGELFHYKKDKLEMLQSVLETRTATVFITGKKYGGDADQQLSLPIQCNFWSLTEVHTKQSLQRDTGVNGLMDFGSLPPNLVDAFGLFIHCSESSPCYPIIPIAQHTLRNAINPGESFYSASSQFTVQDFKELIAFAKNLQVELSSEAERLVHGYYLASRRVRSDSVHGSKLSFAAVKILISLSKAHAKLSLRSKVLEEDAVIAVLLFEISLTLKQGASVLCVAPNAVFPFDLHDESCLQQRDVYLMQCRHEILQFITSYAPAATVCMTEE
ncbi:minichromosome maintenance domain-containing protein 2 [Latimeria chalumnae]|uniref:minichromosome maintenance domain-containing protein 2 n=1 Tax=Latimeria chalumnae TaxID=7897 RepID=UPI00313D857D